MPDTLLTMLRRAVERRGSEPIYRFLLTGEVDGPQQTLSASELERDAQKIAGAIRAHGYHAQDPTPRVVIACHSPIDFARAFFGILSAGALPVPADPPLPRAGNDGLEGLTGIIADARPSLLIGDEQNIAALRKLAPALTVQELIAMETGQYHAGHSPHDAAPDDVAFLQYTSGSTASPRGVLVTHANVLSNLRALQKALLPPRDPVGVTWLPFSHDMGLIGAFLLTLYFTSDQYFTSGQLVVLTPLAFAQRPIRWLQAISRFRAWATAAPNFAFALCNRVIKQVQVENLDLSCLESVLCGAEPIDTNTLQHFCTQFAPQRFPGDRLRPCYGLAEATLFVSAANSLTVKTFDAAALSRGRLKASASQPGRSMASCGPVQDALEIAIVDPSTGRKLPPHEVGEIWISGPSVAKGYFGWPQGKNEDTFRAALDGTNLKYLRTGDLGALCDGELYVTGRQKEMVVIHGRNYDAHDLERTAASAHPKLRAARVAAFSDFEQGESLIILAEARPLEEEHEYRTMARQIRAGLGTALGIQPDKVVIAPSKSIALTTTGKIRRARTRELYESGFIRPLFTDAIAPHGDHDSGVLEHALLREIRIAARLGEREPLPEHVRLSELGIDSLGMAQLATAMEEFVDRDVAFAIIKDDPTVSNLIGRFRQTEPAETSSSQDVFEPAHRFNFPDLMRAAGVMPFYHPFSDWEGTHARLDGRRILILSSFDYLGLSSNPRVREAAARAARDHGTGRSSSRVHSGTTPEMLAMEEKLARFLYRQDVVVCTTGYQAMAGLVTSFMNSRTTLVVDEQIHASILDGAAIAHCRVKRFRHNDTRELNDILRHTSSAMVIVEGLYSNSGDISPLPEIREICSHHGARLALDEAHALGVLGATGRGTEEHFTSLGASDIVAGTFSKSLVSVGGWIAGNRDVVEYIRYHGRPVLFTAGISPPMLAAASASLDVLLEQPELVNRLRHNADWLLQELKRCGVPVTGHGPIFRLPIGDDELCVRLSSELMHRGIYVHTILYPSVPRDAAMIRFCVSAGHDPIELSRAAEETAHCYRMILGSAVSADNTPLVTLP